MAIHRTLVVGISLALVSCVGAWAANAPERPAVVAKAATQVNLNAASVQELKTVKGIGPSLAKAIFEHRTAKGPFRSLEDLRKVKGVGAKKLDQIRDQVTLK